MRACVRACALRVFRLRPSAKSRARSAFACTAPAAVPSRPSPVGSFGAPRRAAATARAGAPYWPRGAVPCARRGRPFLRSRQPRHARATLRLQSLPPSAPCLRSLACFRATPSLTVRVPALDGARPRRVTAFFGGGCWGSGEMGEYVSPCHRPLSAAHNRLSTFTRASSARSRPAPGTHARPRTTATHSTRTRTQTASFDRCPWPRGTPPFPPIPPAQRASDGSSGGNLSPLGCSRRSSAAPALLPPSPSPVSAPWGCARAARATLHDASLEAAAESGGGGGGGGSPYRSPPQPSFLVH